MKLFVALGGFLGFVLVMGVGLAIGRRSPSLLLEASLACVLGALLFRWWHRMLLRNVALALHAQRVIRNTKKPVAGVPEKAHAGKS